MVRVCRSTARWTSQAGLYQHIGGHAEHAEHFGSTEDLSKKETKKGNLHAQMKFEHSPSSLLVSSPTGPRTRSGYQTACARLPA